MKGLYIYNKHDSSELNIIERAKNEFGEQIQILSVDEVPDILKYFISATPALIVITDDLQGERLKSEDVDGSLIATGIIRKRLDEEESYIHNINCERLDSMIKKEKNDAIDSYTIELVEGGLI